MSHTIKLRELTLQVNEFLLRDRPIQNVVKDLRWSALEKKLQFLIIFLKTFILNLLKGSNYVSGFKYVRAWNIRKIS